MVVLLLLPLLSSLALGYSPSEREGLLHMLNLKRYTRTPKRSWLIITRHALCLFSTCLPCVYVPLVISATLAKAKMPLHGLLPFPIISPSSYLPSFSKIYVWKSPNPIDTASDIHNIYGLILVTGHKCSQSLSPILTKHQWVPVTWFLSEKFQMLMGLRRAMLLHMW